ncbi:MAG: redoxin domain-containing protein [Thermodesulfobacteriota bacterium]|nr:redoxin domain-containing protein [Thermodesulfobacteriota bacterium]
MRKRGFVFAVIVVTAFFLSSAAAHGVSNGDTAVFSRAGSYELGALKPTNSALKVKVGDRAPDFTLPAVASGGEVSLSQYLGKKNVVLSFVPAAWTPICSEQWPGYNAVKDIFDQHDSVLLGMTVDNVPTLFMWIRHLCEGDTSFWFPVLSDFMPHGEVADMYGVLRPEGFSERAIFVIDKKGIIRYIEVYDINKVPPLDTLVRELQKLER